MAKEIFKVSLKIKEFLVGKLLIVFLVCFILFVFVVTSFFYIWRGEITAGFYFLPVGEGDSELIVTREGRKILIDGGPLNGNLALFLDRIFPFYDKYIDVVIMTHPQVDHFGGLLNIFNSYRVGIFIDNGDKNNTLSYRMLESLISKKNITRISLRSGDEILNGNDVLKFFNPQRGNALDKDHNENALVFEANVGNIKGLFTSDIGKKTAEQIIDFVSFVDVLKVPHHGSVHSLSNLFFKKISPAVSIIEVGENPYNHPSKKVIDTLFDLKSLVFRTDDNKGIIKVFGDGEKIFISRMK